MTDNEIHDMITEATSSSFKVIVRHASITPGFQVEKMDTKGKHKCFKDWIDDAVTRTEDDQPSNKVFRAISGEFNHHHWNQLDTHFWNRLKDAEWQMWAICCPYISIPKSINSKNSRNETFEFFKANSRPRTSIRLYRSNRRLPCHWIMVGDELHVTDWHEPCEEEMPERYEKTAIIRHDNPEELSSFCLSEFNRMLMWIDFPEDHYELEQELTECELLSSFEKSSNEGLSKGIVDNLPCVNTETGNIISAFTELTDSEIKARFSDDDKVLVLA